MGVTPITSLAQFHEVVRFDMLNIACHLSNVVIISADQW